MQLAGISSMGFGLTKVSGRQAHAQRVLRRLSTARGGLIGSPTYGYDLKGAVGSTVPGHVVAQKVREQCLLDEETTDARVTVTRNGETMTASIDIVSANGPFTLTAIAAEALTYQLIIDGNPSFWGSL
jgi:hypothetical protein